MKTDSFKDASQLRAEILAIIERLDEGIANLNQARSETLKRLRVVEEYLRIANEPPTFEAPLIPTQVPGRSGVGVERKGQRRQRNPNSPDEIARMAAEILLEEGHPLTRSQIASALEARGVRLVAADKAKNVGTILWRHPHLFTNLPGRGYWLAHEPIPLS